MQAPEVLAHKRITRVCTPRDGGEGEAGIDRSGQVLKRVDGQVDPASGKGFFNFLDEDALGVERRAVFESCGRGEVGILHAIARGADDFDLNGMAALTKLRGDVVRLPERELRAARADADGMGAHDYRIPCLRGEASSRGLVPKLRYALDQFSLLTCE